MNQISDAVRLLNQAADLLIASVSNGEAQPTTNPGAMNQPQVSPTTVADRCCCFFYSFFFFFYSLFFLFIFLFFFFFLFVCFVLIFLRDLLHISVKIWFSC